MEFMNSIISRDEEVLKKVAEERFAEKLIAGFEKTKATNLKFEKGSGQLDSIIKEDTTTYGDKKENIRSTMTSNYIVEHMLVLGVSANRKENDCNYDYTLNRDREGAGLKKYKHKYF